MTLESTDSRSRITVRTDDALKEEFEQAVSEGPHSSVSEAVREMIRDYSQRHGDELEDSEGPKDELLSQALETLRRVSGPTGKVSCDAAISAVAEETRVPAAVVKRDLLEPLEELGYIDPRWGKLYVE